MEKQGMESIVVCPDCGEQINVAMSPYQEAVNSLMRVFEGSIGIGKTEHFEGKNKCKCGKTVIATLHITAEANRG